MKGWTLGIALGSILIALVAVPVVARRNEVKVEKGAASVIIVTPHNEQIRMELGDGFARWHKEKYGTPATVIWNTPGGTTEIRKMLEASFLAALRNGTPPGGSADLLFGGGTYEYDQLKKPLSMDVAGQKRSTSVLMPVDFPQSWLTEVYGENDIGGRVLYDPGLYWFGTALSSFGIVYNSQILEKLGLPTPTGWASLADPRLQGEVAMVNPAQSGSIATAMETILLREGWQEGWAILRRTAANSRSISASSTAAPIGVSQGEAAEALCIDFYGRFQQQCVADGGSPGRVGYMDPVGRTAIDPDPIAMLRGAPNPETARRFIEFALSLEGQRLWQFAPGTEGGPKQFGLRRLPARRSLYSTDIAKFMDKVDPWKLAAVMVNPNPNYRSFVSPIFVAMALDNRSLLREAWAAVANHPAYPRDGHVLRAKDAADPTLRAMLTEFDALPVIPGPDGTSFDLSDEASLAAVREGWLKAKWKDKNLWPPLDAPADVLRRIAAEQTAAHLKRVIEISRGAKE